jgi:parvulin-like peptidyl-prolyl isomerase
MAVIDDYEVNEESIRSTINPDEYREFKTECLYVPTAKVSSQKITPFGEEEIEKAYDKIKDITYLIQGGVDFDKVLGQVDGIIHYERSFIISDNTAEKEYKEAAKELDNGEYSDAISTPFGYYIIHMLDNNSSKRYEQAVQSTIIEEKAAQFMIYYDDLMQEYDININSKYWDSIKLGSIISG